MVPVVLDRPFLFHHRYRYRCHSSRVLGWSLFPTVSGYSVQIFSWSHRIHRSKNWLIAGLLAVLAFVTVCQSVIYHNNNILTSQLGSGLSVVVLTQRWTSVQQRLKLQVPLKLWLILDVITSTSTDRPTTLALLNMYRCFHLISLPA